MSAECGGCGFSLGAESKGERRVIECSACGIVLSAVVCDPGAGVSTILPVAIPDYLDLGGAGLREIVAVLQLTKPNRATILALASMLLAESGDDDLARIVAGRFRGVDPKEPLPETKSEPAQA